VDLRHAAGVSGGTEACWQQAPRADDGGVDGQRVVWLVCGPGRAEPCARVEQSRSGVFAAARDCGGRQHGALGPHDIGAVRSQRLRSDDLGVADLHALLCISWVEEERPGVDDGWRTVG
jgi:hypothetical protein